jgi:hypothetical protein
MSVGGISARSIVLTDVASGRHVPIKLIYSTASQTVTLIPLAKLAAGHVYRINVTSGIIAVGGLHLPRTFVATFRTGVR